MAASRDGFLQADAYVLGTKGDGFLQADNYVTNVSGNPAAVISAPTMTTTVTLGIAAPPDAEIAVVSAVDVTGAIGASSPIAAASTATVNTTVGAQLPPAGIALVSSVTQTSTVALGSSASVASTPTVTSTVNVGFPPVEIALASSATQSTTVSSTPAAALSSSVTATTTVTVGYAPVPVVVVSSVAQTSTVVLVPTSFMASTVTVASDVALSRGELAVALSSQVTVSGTVVAGISSVEVPIRLSSALAVSSTMAVAVPIALGSAQQLTTTSVAATSLALDSSVQLGTGSLPAPMRLARSFGPMRADLPTGLELGSSLTLAGVLDQMSTAALASSMDVTGVVGATTTSVLSPAELHVAISSTVGPSTVVFLTRPASLIGGLRARLVRDSLSLTLQDALGELGWFDAGRAHRPVRFVTQPIAYGEPIEPNLVGLSLRSTAETDIELGSSLATISWALAVDVFAEDESLGQHLWGDIRDLLRGRLTPRQRPTAPILDLRQATPTEVGYVEIVDVIATRQWAMVEAPWQRTWFRVEASVEDTYFGEAMAQAEAP